MAEFDLELAVVYLYFCFDFQEYPYMKFLNAIRGLNTWLWVGIFSLAFLGMKPGIDKGYDRIDPFKNGMAKVYKGNTMGFINTKGEEIIACRYHYISDFVNGLAKVMIDKKYGFINLKDEEIVAIKYDFIGPFIDGLAKVRLKNNYGIININGEEITPIIYDEIGPFNKNGEAVVRINQLEGKINRSGEEVVPVYKETKEE